MAVAFESLSSSSSSSSSLIKQLTIATMCRIPSLSANVNNALANKRVLSIPHNRVDNPERDGAEFELDALANQQPVQLPPKLSGTGTMKRLSKSKSKYLLKAYYKRIRNCVTARFGRIECQVWTDVA